MNYLTKIMTETQSRVVYVLAVIPWTLWVAAQYSVERMRAKACDC